jgi:hypothetical protein
MYRKLLLIALASTLFGAANARTLEIIEGAYEAVLGDVTLPESADGSIVVRMCGTCVPTRLDVDAGTRYIGADGRQKSFGDFLADAERLRAAAGGERTTGVGIFYEPDNGRVTRIRLYPDSTS